MNMYSTNNGSIDIDLDYLLGCGWRVFGGRRGGCGGEGFLCDDGEPRVG